MKTHRIFSGIFSDLYRVELLVGGEWHIEIVRLVNPWITRSISQHRNLARVKAIKQARRRFPGKFISVEGWE